MVSPSDVAPVGVCVTRSIRSFTFDPRGITPTKNGVGFGKSSGVVNVIFISLSVAFGTNIRMGVMMGIRKYG